VFKTNSDSTFEGTGPAQQGKKNTHLAQNGGGGHVGRSKGRGGLSKNARPGGLCCLPREKSDLKRVHCGTRGPGFKQVTQMEDRAKDNTKGRKGGGGPCRIEEKRRTGGKSSDKKREGRLVPGVLKTNLWGFLKRRFAESLNRKDCFGGGSCAWPITLYPKTRLVVPGGTIDRFASLNGPGFQCRLLSAEESCVRAEKKKIRPAVIPHIYNQWPNYPSSRGLAQRLYRANDERIGYGP